MPASYTVFAAPRGTWDKSFLKGKDPSFRLYEARPLSLLPSAAGALIGEAEESHKLLAQARQAMARWEQDFRDYEGSGMRYSLRTTPDALGESDEVEALVASQSADRKKGERASRRGKKPTSAQSASAQAVALELPWLEFLRLRDRAAPRRRAGRGEARGATVEQLRSLRRGELTALTSGYAQVVGRMAALQAELDALQRSQAGSLLTADLNSYIPSASDVRRYFETDSLCCVLVVVPRAQEAEFLRGYSDVEAEAVTSAESVESAGSADSPGALEVADAPADSSRPADALDAPRAIPCVVPESAALLRKDDSHALYSVACLKRFRGLVSQRYRDQKYTVREFTPDPLRENSSQRQEDLAAGIDDARKASQEYRKAHIAALLACASDTAKLAASAEGVLRYGEHFDLLVLESVTPKEKAYRSTVEAIFHKLLDKCDRKVYDVDVGAEDAYLPFVMVSLPLAQGAVSLQPAAGGE